MDAKVNENEIIKINSKGLRGTLRESLADGLTGTISKADVQVGKFHGFYEQDDRDVRQARVDSFLEPDYSFMLRARLPGGVCSPEQWQAIDQIGQKLGNGTVRLTTRQTFQYHGILKADMKPLIQELDKILIDSIGGCGDINRNVMCNPLPQQSRVHAEVYDWARRISEHLLPSTRAYHEIWLDEEPVAGGEDAIDPLYGETYLPRKFKTAVAIPPHNDVDVYTNDLGFVAIIENDQLIGFNVLAGGGMGTTHGDKTTFPRLADELGFVGLEHVLDAAAGVLTAQRDLGNRISRRHARLKYTVESVGVDRFRSEVEQRGGFSFEPPRKVAFDSQGDRYGWQQGEDGRWHLTLYIENGRVADTDKVQAISGLRAIAQIHDGDFRITPNQNLIVANVSAATKEQIDKLVREHGLSAEQRSGLRLASIACVALPTCPQAMAESERTLPAFLDRLEPLAEQYGVKQLVLRMTGCPNGCARPFAAEVGLVGKGPGRYNLLLGGDGRGLRLNRLYRENLTEDQIFAELSELFARYADEREGGEGFGDWSVRTGVVREVRDPARDFHD